MTTRGLVLGCGGTVGGAWQVGAVKAVAGALDWDPRTADVIVGTSAGATMAAMLGAGVGVDELLAAQRDDASARESVRRFFTQPPAPRPGRLPFGRPRSLRMTVNGLRSRRPLAALTGLAPAGRTNPSFLDDLVDDLVPGDWVDHPATWVVGADLATGNRVAFGSSAAPRVRMRDAVRASWAIPGWYPPVTMAGREYVDGGAASPTSADLVAGLGLDEVIIVAPMASEHAAGKGVERLVRAPMSRIVDAEVAALQAAGVRVLRVHPEEKELAVMGWNFMDPRYRTAALDAALTHVPGRVTG